MFTAKIQFQPIKKHVMFFTHAILCEWVERKITTITWKLLLEILSFDSITGVESPKSV